MTVIIIMSWNFMLFMVNRDSFVFWAIRHIVCTGL
jgi:hypothetical protein